MVGVSSLRLRLAEGYMVTSPCNVYRAGPKVLRTVLLKDTEQAWVATESMRGWQKCLPFWGGPTEKGRWLVQHAACYFFYHYMIGHICTCAPLLFQLYLNLPDEPADFSTEAGPWLAGSELRSNFSRTCSYFIRASSFTYDRWCL